MSDLPEKVYEQNIWGSYMSVRKAKLVSRALKAAGYRTATVKNCTDFVINVASHFEPGNTEARLKLIRLICVSAGLQPKDGIEAEVKAE